LLIFASKETHAEVNRRGISITVRRTASAHDKRRGCWKRRPERTRITPNVGREPVVPAIQGKVEEETDDAA